ncbi:hypothetical protein G6F70_000473 [Rhizopus microsporus]|nr:hypothetical protein G6F71_000317 [Rhizopus microsporus]KAG1204435.1 hypothetical protein G6F70_000473 [Rhizopus microsporus]KAG1215881.1 hypothetical protein G6F69_000607 [Rhizopus microsporus]KAG1238549.1 hypothetical protein G6F67_000344 [Rhizopus microsporus]KAG1269720.1 hypothetical protein G6F68_000020 [Rhizopus microsporus]
MSESLVLEQYTPFTREATVDIDSWKNIIENSPAHHAVFWIYMNKTNGDVSILNKEDQFYAKARNKKKHHLENQVHMP